MKKIPHLQKEAQEAAARIIQSISTQMIRLVKNKIDLETFKFECHGALQPNNRDIATLKAVDGWQNILANILIAITGVGLLAIGAQSLYYGKLTLFKVVDSDVARASDDCRLAIEKLTTRSEASAH